MSDVVNQYVIKGTTTLTEGQKYRVTSGTFKNVVGILTGMDHRFFPKEEGTSSRMASDTPTSNRAIGESTNGERVNYATLSVDEGSRDGFGYLLIPPRDLELVK